MTEASARAGDASWEEFGQRLRSWRRAAGLTQSQLGLRVGYHHSVVSKLEAGLREPPIGLVRRLDSVLGTGGELAAVIAAPRDVPRGSGRLPAGLALSAPLPGADTADGYGVFDPRLWPARLPAEGLVCPLHGTAGCAVPEQSELAELLGGPSALAAGSVPRSTADAEPELLHGLTAVLACLIRESFRQSPEDHRVAVVDGLLRALVRWAEAVNATGRLPYGQLRLAAQYAQVAGRLRMDRGQNAVAMAWFGHGLRWADAVQDAPARATLLSDMCTLVRLDGDAGAMLAYAAGVGAADTGRRWMATLSGLYQARGHALAGNAAECRRHLTLARRKFACLDRRDLLEAPWLAGTEGEMRMDSAIGGALRDLAVVTGDRAAARRAVDATARSCARVPPQMRPTRLLLTLRLADSWACAGDAAAAAALACEVLGDALRSRESMVRAELRGLHSRLVGQWPDVPEVREYRERLLDAGE